MNQTGLNQVGQPQAQAKDGNLVIDGMLTVVAILRALNMGYHHAHINVKGPTYYGDHILLQRLYFGEADDGAPILEIDSVMERLKGLYPTRLIPLGEILTRMAHEYQMIQGIDADSDNTAKFQELVKLEMRLQSVLSKLIADLQDATVLGSGTDGTLNLLQGIADKHQQNVYLINQRIQ